ncbi:unnamed protein product [Owenia fusiformis]|uniref:RUN domain-containing protein n=1 Tax=Owenia fusiformis TaxID=6347 RepID=A0A8S4P2H6_OWEFU|nr:unnamed protein product [Owenia fusiformis]
MNTRAMVIISRLHSSQHKEESTQKQALGIMKRALTILQIFAISQFGCGGREFQKNLLKRTPKGNHWGDIRARLEVAITKVIDLYNQQQHLMPVDSDYTSDNEDTPACQANLELTQAIRKELAMALKDLLQHGLMEVGQSTALVPFGCFSNRSARTAKANTMMHAWDLIEKYYDMKKGKQYNESPARKLSMSFALDMVGGQAVTTKQTLLGAIGTIINSHEPLKRSQDSKFKAFVCLGLNEKKLVSWLRLIVRTQSLIDYYYQSWSYVSRTGGEDIWQSLDKLKELNFNLPMDLAVRQFSNIKDAF